MAGWIVLSDGAISVAGNTDKVEGGIERNLSREVAQENRSAFENADEDEGLALEVARNLFSHLGDTLGYLFTGQQYFEFRH